MDCLLQEPDETTQDEMAFKPTKDHDEWLRAGIKKHLAPKTLPEKLKSWVRNWGVAGSVMTACIAITIFIATQISGNSKFQGTTEARLNTTSEQLKSVTEQFKGITEQFEGIDAQIASLRASISSSQPTQKQNQQDAKKLIGEARKGTVQLPLPAVEQSGNRFIDVSATDQSAWNVAVDYVNYRTELNRKLLGTGWELGWDPVSLQFQKLIPPTPPVPGRLHFDSYQRGHVTLADAFAFYSIGAKNPWLEGPQSSGNNYPRDLRLDYGVFDLDGMTLINVWFVNSIIQYKGGALSMNNVAFIDCQFVMPNLPKTRSVATTLLAKASVEATIN